MTKAEILAALAKLAPAELVEVETAAKLLRSLSAGNRVTPQAVPALADDWLLSGIAAYLVARGLLSHKHPMLELQHRTAFHQYQSKLPALLAWLTALEANNKISKRQRTTLSFLCARALADLLTKRAYFSVGAMLSQIDKVPEALDQAFPGYVAAGLFGHVLLHLDRSLL